MFTWTYQVSSLDIDGRTKAMDNLSFDEQMSEVQTVVKPIFVIKGLDCNTSETLCEVQRSVVRITIGI